MDALKVQRSRYEGLSIPALLFLAKSDAPIDLKKRSLVFQELFVRYFRQGRNFNLYLHLEKFPWYMAHALPYELGQLETEIPIEHSEAFMKCILSFIEFIDKNVIEKNLQFEWQLHEMNGLKDMLEKIRKAKIKDTVLRQKINEFIDKMNNARKKTLELMETKSSSQEVAVIEEKKELMKQELEHLSIRLSKLKKDEMKQLMYEFERFYPEDQDKILKRLLKKHSDLFFSEHFGAKLALLAFKKNLTFQIPNVNMLRLLKESLRYSLSDFESIAGGNLHDFIAFLKTWYENAEHASPEWTEKVIEYFQLEMGKMSSWNRRNDQKSQEKSHLAWNVLIQRVERVFRLLEDHPTNTLSNLLTNRIPTKESQYGFPCVMFDSQKKRWVATEPTLHVRNISLLELAQNVMDLVQSYDLLKNPHLSDAVRKQIQAIEHVLNHAALTSDVLINDRDDWDQVQKWFVQKYRNKGFTTSDWRILFTEKYDIFTKILDSNFGFSFRMSNVVKEQLHQALPWFDFTNEEQLEKFFQFPVVPEEFYATENGIRLCDKLEKERPHEIAFLAEYFWSEGQEHTKTVIGERFAGLSALDQLLLTNYGVDLELRQKKEFGHKLKIHGKDTVVTEEELKRLYILKFFVSLYKKD